MNKYRIKKEAAPYILEEHVTKIYDLDTWNKLGLDIKALEEVKPMYLSFGIKRGDICTTLGGWSKEDGSSFEFTIHFPSVKFNEHDKFCNGRIMRELMNKIQRHIDNFYEEYLQGKLTNEEENGNN